VSKLVGSRVLGLRFAALAVLALAVGCVAQLPVKPPPEHVAAAPLDPALRPAHAIGFVDARPGPFYSEEQLFGVIRALYRDNGFADVADQVRLRLSEEVAIPWASGETVWSRRFLGDGPAYRAHLKLVSKLYYGGRLDDYGTHFEGASQALEAYQVFMTALLGHEFAHAVASLRDAQQLERDPWAEETRAIRFEYAVMGELQRIGQIPRRWMGLLDKFNRALLRGAPKGLVSSLPKRQSARRARFNEAYPKMLGASFAEHGVDHAQHATDVVLASYTIYRLEQGKKTLLLHQLEKQIVRPPPEPAPIAKDVSFALSMRQLDSQVSGVDQESMSLTFKHALGDWTMKLRPIEPGQRPELKAGLLLQSTLPKPVVAKRRAAVAELLMRINRGLALGRMVLDFDEGTVLIETVEAGSRHQRPSPSAAINRHAALVRRWVGAIYAVAFERKKPTEVSPLEADGKAANSKPANKTEKTP